MSSADGGARKSNRVKTIKIFLTPGPKAWVPAKNFYAELASHGGGQVLTRLEFRAEGREQSSRASFASPTFYHGTGQSPRKGARQWETAATVTGTKTGSAATRILNTWNRWNLMTAARFGRRTDDMMTCKRPDWSTPSNDYCPCDDPSFEPAVAAGEVPCEDCHWWMDVTEVW